MSKPILFSTAMVQAILDNRKSMTRRVSKTMPYPNIKPPYQPGDILWVRETWAVPYNPTTGYAYRASCHDDALDLFKWRPSIFMPRSAARIWLKVTDIRVERLRAITPHDAWLEGCRIGNSFAWEDHLPDLQQMCRDIAFVSLWDSINKKRGHGWDTNPWVWVISFERIDKGDVT